MILQQKIASSETTFPNQNITGLGQPQQSLAIPDQAMNLKFAMMQYKRGTLVERAKGYYEQKGLEVPDFDRMSKVEKLMALAEFRKTVKNATDEIGTLSAQLKSQKNELVQEQKAKASAGKGSSVRPDTAGKDGGN